MMEVCSRKNDSQMESESWRLFYRIYRALCYVGIVLLIDMHWLVAMGVLSKVLQWPPLVWDLSFGVLVAVNLYFIVIAMSAVMRNIPIIKNDGKRRQIRKRSLRFGLASWRMIVTAASAAGIMIVPVFILAIGAVFYEISHAPPMVRQLAQVLFWSWCSICAILAVCCLMGMVIYLPSYKREDSVGEEDGVIECRP